MPHHFKSLLEIYDDIEELAQRLKKLTVLYLFANPAVMYYIYFLTIRLLVFMMLFEMINGRKLKTKRSKLL